MKNYREVYLLVLENLRQAEILAKKYPTIENLSDVIRLRKYAASVYREIPRHHQLDPAKIPGQGIGNGPTLTKPGSVRYEGPKKVNRKLKNDGSNWVMSFRGQDN